MPSLLKAGKMLVAHVAVSLLKDGIKSLKGCCVILYA
jgi:hypothetical protein